MNELELAERFNRELDGVFQEGKSVNFSPDQAAMDLAAELARADFSAESAIKESLRERLVPAVLPAMGAQTAELAGADLSGGFAGAVRGLLRNVYARAALAAACLLLVLVPIFHRSGGPGGEPAPASVPARPAESGGIITAAANLREPAVRVPVRIRRAGVSAEPGVFNSIPMARLKVESIQAFPIESAGGGTPIILAKGREVRLENGSRIVLETEHVIFTFERRVISPEELFERRSL